MGYYKKSRTEQEYDDMEDGMLEALKEAAKRLKEQEEADRKKKQDEEAKK